MFINKIIDGTCLNRYFASFICYPKIKQWNGTEERNMKLRASQKITRWKQLILVGVTLTNRHP